MSVKSPVSDDVFAKFINKTPAGKLEKKFSVKGVKFEKSHISAAESVQNVVKSAVFFFRSSFSQQKASKFQKEEEVDLKKLSKTTFYDFKKDVSSEWKGEETVPMFNSISGVNCKKCTGKGYIACKKCEGSGIKKCSKCDGVGRVECKNCKGTGVLEVEIEVIDGNTGKKQKKPLKYQCGECLGSKTTICKSCDGHAKTICDNCKPNSGKVYCNECKGTGKFYKYRIETVPFKVTGQIIDHLFFKPEFEKQIGEELGKVIDSVDGILIKNLDDMDEKFVKAQLGFFDGDIKTRMSDSKKLFKELEKKKGPESPKFPIYLFPILRLEVKTEKGKKFDVISIGTEKGYDVFTPHF